MRVRNNGMGWYLWWVELGPIHIGCDLAQWGLGFAIGRRSAWWFQFSMGPFYIVNR